ncbi:ECF RNA polymerase sigma factor SigK [Amycolatopsis sp. NPDC089917]|uniref:ECF RNA polymerase sigma factor SigK n=1 Tax=Amycolatopsis sp. NPDC089917 TaxID=3155187 RepID=UPI0034186040
MTTAHATVTVLRQPFRSAPEPEPPSTSEELLGRVARGDEQAFAALYDRLAAPVFGTVLHVLRSRALAEEVTQEVMVEIWRKASRFDAGRAKVSTWALTIAHRRAIDRVRSEQAARDREDRVELLDLRRPYDDVAEAALSTEEHHLVRQALSGLTELQRESILLAYFHGLTCQEVADRLGVALGTIKTRVRDGMIRLRDALGATR